MADVDDGGGYRAEGATKYEEQATAVFWHGHEVLFGLMYEYVLPGESLLDIGIGTGLSSVLFHKAGLRVSGFDDSADMLLGCSQKGFLGEVIRHDLRSVPFPYGPGSFRHVISLAVLNFFHDLGPVFGEVGRVVEPKGVFGFTVEGRRPDQEARYRLRVDGAGGPGEGASEVTMYRHSDEHIRALLGGARFEVLKDFEFLADRYPEQGVDVRFRVYVAQQGA